MKPLAIDLFCGLGGWTEGLIAEGYEVIGFDIERHDYGTGGYPAQLVLQDVLSLHGKQFKNAALIVASPPCQAYSYRAMPWSRAKALPPPDNTLFDSCFRIQREAIAAAGHFIPLVVENVRGACPWVGRSRWNYGSFHLWGDVPALMPMTNKRAIMKNGIAHRSNGATNFHGQKIPGFRFDGSGKSFQTATVSETGFKSTGLNWSNRDLKGQDFTRVAAAQCGVKCIPHNPAGHWANPDENGVKGFMPNGEPLGKNKLARKFGSKSKGRKAASAAIAKIPMPLAQYIARVYFPRSMA